MITKLKARVGNDKLLSNSLYLMLATGAMALFGFVFWIVVAHMFKSTTVGLATTLLSMSGLIASLSLVGFDTVFIRFLPKAENRNAHIDSGLMMVGIASAILSAGFCALVPHLAPKLTFVDHNLWYILSFVIFTIFTAWNTLTNAVFVAYRETRYVLVINIIFSAIKMVLPFAVMHGGPMAIFAVAGIAQVINVLLSLAAMMKYFGYRPAPIIHRDVVREVRKYSSGSYVASFLNLMPITVLPLVVTNQLGPSQAAFFYIAFTIANLIFTIGYSTTQSLFAESSHNEEKLDANLRRGFKIAVIIGAPAIVVLLLAGQLILKPFGHDYADGATTILRVLGASSIFVYMYSALNALFKVTKDIRAMIVVNIFYAGIIIGLGWALAKPLHLLGVGIAWASGNFAATIVGLYFRRRAAQREAASA
ncbi:MAG TPA: oligosaccharide flippase family protein [Candidatus Saccharimonadales bacterium]